VPDQPVRRCILADVRRRPCGAVPSRPLRATCFAAPVELRQHPASHAPIPPAVHGITPQPHLRRPPPLRRTPHPPAIPRQLSSSPGRGPEGSAATARSGASLGLARPATTTRELRAVERRRPPVRPTGGTQRCAPVDGVPLGSPGGPRSAQEMQAYPAGARSRLPTPTRAESAALMKPQAEVLRQPSLPNGLWGVPAAILPGLTIRSRAPAPPLRGARAHRPALHRAPPRPRATAPIPMLALPRPAEHGRSCKFRPQVRHLPRRQLPRLIESRDHDPRRPTTSALAVLSAGHGRASRAARAAARTCTCPRRVTARPRAAGRRVDDHSIACVRHATPFVMVAWAVHGPTSACCSRRQRRVRRAMPGT
jgi:hypothetical protein